MVGWLQEAQAHTDQQPPGGLREIHAQAQLPQAPFVDKFSDLICLSDVEDSHSSTRLILYDQIEI